MNQDTKEIIYYSYDKEEYDFIQIVIERRLNSYTSKNNIIYHDGYSNIFSSSKDIFSSSKENLMNRGSQTKNLTTTELNISIELFDMLNSEDNELRLLAFNLVKNKINETNRNNK